MNDHDKQKEFLNNCNNVLNDGLNSIDDNTRRRLTNIRHTVLTQKQEPSQWFKPMMILATTASLFIALTLWINTSNHINDSLALEDISLLTDSEDLEFYQELEFYNWLEDEQIKG